MGLPSELARRRPDIRRAEAQLHASVAMQGVAVADLYPRVMLGASGGFQGSHPAALTDWAARYLTIDPTVSLPLFDGGRRRAAIQLQDTRAKEAALAYAQAVLGALHEAEAQSLLAADEDLVALYRALGGGWEAATSGS